MGISDQDRTEFELERMRRALEAEFEEFVSMAAHNLRESLRDVASFSQLMAETYTGRLDSDAGVFLERIQEGAARMQSLLADMVDYWATGTQDRQASRTDMEAVLSQALLSTDKQMTERSAMVTHDPLPAVTGDFETLTKVLHHLIGNAIEYCGTLSPHVHISSGRVDSDWVFSVADNGPGIDPAFQARIFGVFKRLHGK
jgi:chemotaxis family two-component system sensor kinase Cph1